MKYKLVVGLISAFIILLLVSLPTVDYKENEMQMLVNMDNKNIYHRSEQVSLDNLNNSLFSDSEYAYNHKLAVESLKLAVSAFSSGVNELNWGKFTGANRDKDVVKYFTDNKFSNIKSYNYDISLNDDSSKVAFAIAEKIYNNNTDIVAVAIRGGYYGLEWIDNFNIGTTENSFHAGFKTAADEVMQELREYLLKNASGKSVKLWICGYSRGGAVANILASMLVAKRQEFPCQVYAYTFASPKSVIVNAEKAHDTVYRNIFNILSPNDPLYNIPPEKWGFGRYGICVVLPNNNDVSYDGAQNMKSNVEKSYFSYTGKKLALSENNIDTMVNVVIKTSESRDFFAGKLSAPICDLIRLNLEKYEDEKGHWVQYKTEKMIEKLHGKSGLESYRRIRQNSFFKSLDQLGISIPEEFYVFIVLCHLNGCSEYENILFTEINIEELESISRITSSSSLFDAHAPEFYMSWLENINVSLLKFTKE